MTYGEHLKRIFYLYVIYMGPPIKFSEHNQDKLLKYKVVICVNPYSTQATNRQNRHELFFNLFGGIREVSLKKILQS